MDFTSVRNTHEQAVFEGVARQAPNFPLLAADPDLLADVACVALNRLPARYIRHAADLSFYRSPSQHEAEAQALAQAITHAFGYVQARHALAARR